MKLKPGLPLTTFASLKKKFINKQTKGYFYLLSLVDMLLCYGKVKNAKSNITLQSSLGFHDISNNKLNYEILNILNLDNSKIKFNEQQENINDTLGVICIDSIEIPVFAGVGDFQAALYGSGFPENSNAILNLGTGSQVAIISKNKKIIREHERRKLLSGEIASVISHIPSGRALNVVASFIDAIAAASHGNQSLFWNLWFDLDAAEILSNQPNSRLSFFDSAWSVDSIHYPFGWIALRENQVSIRSVVSEIARSWVEQYVQALSLLDKDSSLSSVSITGGLAHKSKFLIEVFSELKPNYKFKTTNNITGEDTLDGILKLCKYRKLNG